MNFETTTYSRGDPPNMRLHGQTYNRIWSMLPEVEQPPKYDQLYIFDTNNKVEKTWLIVSGIVIP